MSGVFPPPTGHLSPEVATRATKAAVFSACFALANGGRWRASVLHALPFRGSIDASNRARTMPAAIAKARKTSRGGADPGALTPVPLEVISTNLRAQISEERDLNCCEPHGPANFI